MSKPCPGEIYAQLEIKDEKELKNYEENLNHGEFVEKGALKRIKRHELRVYLGGTYSSLHKVEVTPKTKHS